MLRALPTFGALTVIAILALAARSILQVGLQIRLRQRGPAFRVAVPLLLLGFVVPSLGWASPAPLPLPLQWRSPAVASGEGEISARRAFGARAVEGVFRHAQTAAKDQRKWDGPGFGRNTARFLQVDPSGYADSPNLYAGFGNDPVNHRDPTGRQAFDAGRYVDNFTLAFYRPSYRSEGGRLSTWITLMFPDGTLVDIDLEKVAARSSDTHASIEAFSIAQGDGEIQFPSEMNSLTSPRVVAAAEAARGAIDRFNFEFTLDVATHTIVIPLVLSAGPSFARVQDMRSLNFREHGPSPSFPGEEAFAPVNTKISRQRQLRHIEGTPEWIKRGRGGYFKNPRDAQAVLDAYHSGRARILGRSSRGEPVIEVQSVTGYHNSPGSGYVDQPTNVFKIKGTTKPSVVPMNPRWMPGNVDD